MYFSVFMLVLKNLYIVFKKSFSDTKTTVFCDY